MTLFEDGLARPQDAERLAALDTYDILDTEPEQGFEDLTLLASRICDTPVALVSLVDRDRQWFKARIGFPDCETDLSRSVCKFVLTEPDVLVIPDLTLDVRTKANPLVTNEPSIRFYAGAPLRTPEGVTVGSLCVIDTKPRPDGLTESQRETLRALARQVTMLLDLRRKSATQARTAVVLRDNEARLQAMVDQASAGIAQTSLEGRFTFVNDHYCSMLGRTREELLSLRMHDLTHPDNLPANAEQFRNLAQGGSAFEVEKRYLRPDGSTIWVRNSVTAVRDEDGRVRSLLAVSLDITEQKRATLRRAEAEAALREANESLEQRIATALGEREKIEEALRQSQKMEAVGQLTGGLAHDFNNLLAGISGSLELMQTRMQQGRLTDVDRYMTAAQGATKRAAALTHRLLAFSRRQTLDPKPTDVNRLANGMQELVQRTVGPAIPVEVVGASGLWPALVDPPQLENALLNLCINARDAMPEGGRITIETANKWFDKRAARTQDIPEGQYLALSVTDTGTGMTPEVIARVFEPFFTTKPIGEGTGLGLSMIYGFAQQSGGQVRIYSEVDQGTTVSIYLPRHYGEIEDEAQSDRLDALPRSEQGETVLVVDDEPTVRMLVADILEDLGYTAIEAGDSAAGLKVLQSDVRIDLLVTDVGLPGGMNGRQMADAARVGRPDLKVLFITGYAENAFLGNGHLAPGMAVLTKPFPIETMAARIRSMIEARR